ncbi:MAG: hypothetical protein QOF85_1921 [Solirubrobacterales bacterium]|nr:hypothetical protein [Solirubrobacterales bacterium]
MGVVYLARDERLERRVALKVIAPQLALDEDFRERFVIEARSAAAIDHPNAVPVYSSAVADGALYIAMRYIDGTDLRSLLERQGPLPAAVATAIVGEIAAALDAAHRAGMVHRDVKPANILLEGKPGQDKAYLTDFGLTKGRTDESAQLTGTGQWVGTIDYVAPEQIQAGKVDARTDIYALGCVLYEILSGSVPFTGNDMQKMWGHVNEPFPTLELEGSRRDALAAVIARATAKDPADRYPSAGDFARSASAATGGVQAGSSEESVATGAAASGLTEVSSQTPSPAPTAATVTGRAPTPGPRDSPTTQMPSPPPRQDRGGGSLRTAAIIGGSLVIAAGLIAAAVVIAGGSSSGDKPTTTASHKPQPHKAAVSKPRGSALPPNVEPCSSTVFVKERQSGEHYTSCPFALEVERAYVGSGESSPISAYSPTTGKLYTMTCTGVAPVACRGGENATVYITTTATSSYSEGKAETETASSSTVDLGDWPGGSGYSAMLGAFSSELRADRLQEEASERGLPTGVVYSSNFSSLKPGYWVVFSGKFATFDEASAQASEARSLGYADSYPRLVLP